MSAARAGLGSLIYGCLTWAAIMTKSHWVLAPVGPSEAPVDVGGGQSNEALRKLPLTCAPYLLHSEVPTRPPLSFSSAPHPLSVPGTKGVIGLKKAELPGILNDDTL